MAKKQQPPMVAAVEGDYIYTTGGAEIGMRVGDKVEILKPSKDIVHPKTGEKVGAYHIKVADAVVKSVMPRAAVLVRDYPGAFAVGLFGWEKPKVWTNEITVGDLVAKAENQEQPEEEEEKTLSEAEHKAKAVAAAKKLEEEDTTDAASE